MQFNDQTELFENYQEQWVALTDDDEVICAAPTLEAVLEGARRKGYEEPVTARMPNLEFEFVL
jgi:hypothetical protein